MTEVTLHVYHVTNSGYVKTNNTIIQINKLFKDVIGLGGIFHSAVQVYGDKEWSFGFCEQGTGVYGCPATKNPTYTLRNSIRLGKISFSDIEVNQILSELRMEWPGKSYDLLSNNGNHFCAKFAERLGVQSLPGWVNRFANAADTAADIAEDTGDRCLKTKTEIINSGGTQDSDGNSNRGNPRFLDTWLKNFIKPGAKPSSSSIDPDNKEEDVTTGQQHKEEDCDDD